MLNFQKLTNNFFVNKDLFKKDNFRKTLKLLKITSLSGHFSKTVRGRETYKHFLNTIYCEEKKVIPGENAYW